MGEKPMLDTIVSTLRSAAKSDKYCTKFTTKYDDLALTIEKFGVVKFPVSAGTAKSLIKIAKPAKFGRIANWRDCCYDQSCFKPNPATDSEPNPPVEVKISRDEMGALLEGSIYDPDSERIIYTARPSKTAILFKGLYGDMDNFVGFLASDANHEENKKRRQLLARVYDRVSNAVQKVYEANDLGSY
jgi:hypothetical protein